MIEVVRQVLDRREIDMIQSTEISAEEAIEQIKDEDTRKQLAGCLQYLKQHLEKVELKGDLRSCSYYTCGQFHNKRNPNWKPFRHLEAYCKKAGLNWAGIREMIENRIGRRVECECQILNDDKEVKRKKLWVAFGMDFGESGKRSMDVV
jgi:hypothetical protein